MDSSWVLFAALGVLVLWFVMRTQLGKVAPDQARELVAQGALLIDVRTRGEFSSGHIDGAERYFDWGLALGTW